MTQTFWDTEAAEEPQTDPLPERTQAPKAPEQPGPEADASTLALSADDFAALEERILRAVELVKRERQARAEAEDRAAKAEAELAAQAPLSAQLKQEVRSLRAERDQIRQRVERLLSQLDTLEL